MDAFFQATFSVYYVDLIDSKKLAYFRTSLKRSDILACYLQALVTTFQTLFQCKLNSYYLDEYLEP